MPTNSPTTGSTTTSVPEITSFTLNQTDANANVSVVTQQGTAANGTGVTKVTLQTTTQDTDVKVTGNLAGLVTAYYDDEGNDAKTALMSQISEYAAEIKCEDFHGKGTVEDYSALFQAASRIANDAKQMQLDVEIEGFNEFGVAADNLSALFHNFTLKLQTVSIIDDMAFLQAVATALSKIVNLSNVFGKFQHTIVAVASVELPKSAKETRQLIQSMMSELNCAMTYITNFVSPDPDAPAAASLSSSEKDIIAKATSTLDNWAALCDQGVTIAMSSNSDVQYLNSASADLKTKASTLASATSLLRTKLQQFNIA